MSTVKFTLAGIRDQLREGHFNGDPFQALQFLMNEYDFLWKKYREINNPQEYTVKRYDVV